MRIYSFRNFPADGGLRSCLRADDSFRPNKRDSDGQRRSESVQPYQDSAFEIVSGGTDRINVTHLRTISGYVFCTPRCYTTKSWEVGICNSYYVRYLCGGASLTSFDLHVILVMETIQVYLQQIEIREQSVGYFYIPDELCLSFKLPRVPAPIPESCQKLWKLLLSMKRGKKVEEMTVTSMMAQLNSVRREYFQDLHLDVKMATKSPHRLSLKMLGHLYGKIIGQSRATGIIVRQYFGQCPLQKQVHLVLINILIN